MSPLRRLAQHVQWLAAAWISLVFYAWTESGGMPPDPETPSGLILLGVQKFKQEIAYTIRDRNDRKAILIHFRSGLIKAYDKAYDEALKAWEPLLKEPGCGENIALYNNLACARFEKPGQDGAQRKQALKEIDLAQALLAHHAGVFPMLERLSVERIVTHNHGYLHRAFSD